MLKITSIVILAAAAVSCGGAPQQPAAPAPPATPPAAASGWTVSDMRTPESAYVDEGSGSLFVSQIDGQPDGRDGKGRISKLGLDGTVVAADWFSGLNAPKGLRGHGGTLWVADLDEVIGIDIASAKETARVKIEGAQFLNDVATGADGTVYVSDMLGNRIYAVKDGEAAVFAEGEDLEYPNGLLVDGEQLIVGGWGKPEADFSTKVPGRLYRLDLKTKQKTLITAQPLGNIDGVERDGRGGFLVTDYLKGAAIQVAPDGTSRIVRTFASGLADHSFLAARGNVLIAPHMNENAVAAYDLGPEMTQAPVAQ